MIPPRTIPPELYDRFTLNGRVEVVSLYYDDRNSVGDYTRERVDWYMERARNGEKFRYGPTDLWLLDALKRYPIAGMDVAVFGSCEPAYEAVCLEYGAKPFTIEYGARVSEDERLTFLTPSEALGWGFNAGISVSSFEHFGQGRFGEPLDPDGDLKSMQNAAELLKPGAILYLSVPIGRDVTVHNAHRCYGPIRLPLLLDGWEILEILGPEPRLFTADFQPEPESWAAYFANRNPAPPQYDPDALPEPVFVLRKP